MRIPLEEAKKLICGKTARLPAADVPVLGALGSILAEDVTAPIDQPPFPRSPYDGYALRSADSVGASEETPVCLRVTGRAFAGVPANATVGAGECVRIMTGGIIPEGADCVIAQEHTDEGEEQVRVYKSLKPYANYCHAGEDYHKGDTLVHEGERVTAAVCAVASGAGRTSLRVIKKPRVAVFSTGDEVQVPGKPLAPGQIYTSNSAYLIGRLTELGLSASDVGPVADALDDTFVAFKNAAESFDFVISTGGVSVGQKDLVPAALKALGAEIVFHGVDIKPGMPACFAIYNGTPILALSGNPFAAAASFELLGRLVCAILSGDESLDCCAVTARLSENYTGKRGCRRFLSGTLTEGFVTMPEVQSNGRLKNMVGCNCLVEIPIGEGTLAAGTALPVWLL